MTRTAMGILLIAALAGVPVAAQTLQFGDGGDLAIRTRISEENGRSVLRFAMPTASGLLRGSTFIDAHGPESTSLWLDDGERAFIEYLGGEESDDLEVRLEFVTGGQPLGEMVFAVSASGVVLERHGVRDCRRLALSPIYAAVNDAASRLTREGAQLAQDGLVAVIGLNLMLSSSFPDLVEQCAGMSPLMVECQAERTFDDCIRCCSKYDDWEVACYAGVAICAVATQSSWCTRAAAMCGVVGKLEKLLCGVNKCTGMPGDPDCINPPPCTQIWGTCMNGGFCPPGDRATCGRCADEDVPCCVD